MADGDDRLIGENGTEIPGLLVTARDPALILVHEVFGLNEQMRGVARRYAAEGFTVFAIDLLGGRTTDDLAVGIGNAQLLSWNTAMDLTRVALRALRARLPEGHEARVGILGYGLGGGVAIGAAAREPDLAACVSVYGVPPAERANLPGIRCKVQGHFARFDKIVSNDRVDALEAKLTAAGVQVEFHRYHGEHAFCDETRRDTYSASNTQLVFRRSAAFLKKELTGSY